jgi:phage tail sheath protein FI
MPVQVRYPGVYVQEVPSGVRAITGVSTSVAAFIGMTTRGRMDVPTRVLSFGDYERAFGNDTVISEMTDQVRQFFQNGGREAFITRIASGHASATVNIENAGSDAVVMTLTAKEAGVDGNMICAEVDYATPSPESTFNMRIFRHVVNAFGELEVQAEENLQNLSMAPSQGRFVESVVNQQSRLVDVEVSSTINASVPRFAGYSLSGLVLDATVPFDPDIRLALNAITAAGNNRIQISVDDSPFVTALLPELVDTTTPFSEWQTSINTALNLFGVQLTIALVPGPTGAQYLRLLSNNADGGSVHIAPAATNDAAVALQLGVAQGGLEVNGYANQRPAPTGFFATLGVLSGAGLVALNGFAEAQKQDLANWTLSDSSGGAHSGVAQPITFPGTATDPMYVGAAFPPSGVFLGSLRNVHENLQFLANAIAANTGNLWRAAVQGQGHRMVLTPSYGGVNADTTATLASGPGYDLGTGLFTANPNVRAYSLGGGGIATDYQTPGTPGNNGGVPSTQDYRDAFAVIDRQVDLFNLLILPRANGQSDTQREALWGPASSFCLSRRAFLLMDPRSEGNDWSTVNEIASEILQLRIGLVKDHAAIYWPRLVIATNGTTKAIDPSGSIAGLMARIDANRGVWKAPAGIEADIRGIRSVDHSMSDPENGVINPQAVNAIRVFPNGIVSWGARTMDGFDNSGNLDYKYVPVRRLALFIEESLYRGLKFAVFEPNDEPLWAQIRLAAGAFMNNLFRQGAFQGQKASDAYFVKVDAETTTQNDINLGIVNVVVGFAPLKPAEFVIITIQQMAGQVQT